MIHLNRRWPAALVLLVFSLALAACGSAVPGARSGQTEATPSAAPSATRTASPSPTASPTTTPSPTPTATPTPVPAPTQVPLGSFDSSRLLPGIEPQGYLDDACRYLYLRWSPGKASPGTIVAPIMYHSVTPDYRIITDNISVTSSYFEATMRRARQLGYETITTEQFVDFLYNNARIPERSLLLIVDDRRPGVIREHFMPILEEYDWTVTLAYITGPAMAWEWRELTEMNATGRIDVQAHGFMHNGETYFTEETPPEIIHQEIYNPIPLIEERLGRRPLAFIWPGGNYTRETVKEVRKAGYKVGLTVHSSGPVMFNWVPMGPAQREMDDPLMVLPRYWSTAAFVNLEDAAAIGDEARAYALEHRQDELDWYAYYCRSYPAIEDPLAGVE